MEYYCKKSWQSGHFIGRVKSHDELIENARKLIQDFQNARSEIGDDFPSLVETAIELEELDKSVALVQQEESLRTAAVIREIKGTIRSVHYQSWEAVRVGIIGNEKDGFSIRPDKVFEMNEKAKDVLGIHMVLALRLWDEPTCIGGQGTYPDDESKGEGAGQHCTAVEGIDDEKHDAEESSVYDNITLDQARAMAGEVGVQGWTEAARLQPRRMKR
ncbi:hypothetical protein FoTM2_001385 [Fusarium oxysporum f. sp. vasinfectum]|nr:hypothetical protein FoTM2_001385 [Fusarium oxysporum f. sp. vasinfectum]